MKTFLKKALVGVLIGVHCLTAVACDDTTPSAGNNPQSATVHIWTASGVEKVLRDTDYADRYDNSTLEIAAFRNEYEAGQIIISPEEDIEEYTLELSDLSLTSDSSVKLSKNDFKVYNQKYVNVEQVVELVSTGGGYYPDALLPYEKAVEYSENTVDAGRNQGLWITVKPTKEQEPGVYTGSFKLTVDGQERFVPVEITVYGHILSDEPHMKTSYGTNWDWVSRAELDVTIDMQRAYYEFMLDHRTSTGELPGNFYNVVTKPYLSIPATFLEEAHKATEDPRCTNYALSNNSCIVVDEDGIERLAFDFDYFRMLLTEMAEYSVEHKVDLFKKATYTMVFLDEYSAWGKEESAAFNFDRVWGFTKDLATEFEESLACDDAEFKQTLLESLSNIICFSAGDPLVLEEYSDKWPNANIVPVPTVKDYHPEGYREKLDEYISKGYNEKWIYTACNLYPHTSHFIEAPAMSPRLNGWMMFDYDITGELFWETAFYHEWDTNQGALQVQDQYNTSMRQRNSNGEGQLLYPGREYGIFGPVGSIRLDAIRDSHEDYDLLYELEALYKMRGVTEQEFDSLYQAMSEGLYIGTKFTENENAIDILNNGRRTLAKLFDLYEENGVVLHGYNVSSGKCEVKLSAPSNATVQVNDTALNGVEQDGVMLYSHTFALDKDENVLNVQAKTGDVSNTVEFALGGKTTTIAITDVNDKCTVQSGATKETDQALQCIKVIPDAQASEVRVKLDTSAWQIDETRDNVSVRIYVYGDQEIQMDILAKLKNVRALKDLTNATLLPGWNEIKIDVATDLKCSTNGILEYLSFELDSENLVAFGLGEMIIVG